MFNNCTTSNRKPAWQSVYRYAAEAVSQCAIHTEASAESKVIEMLTAGDGIIITGTTENHYHEVMVDMDRKGYVKQNCLKAKNDF